MPSVSLSQVSRAELFAVFKDEKLVRIMEALIQAAGATLSAGTVTSVSVASANGFAATVVNSTTTPQITLKTTLTGLLKGDGTAMSVAAAGTDYEAPGAVAAHAALPDPHPQYALDSDLTGYVPVTRTVNGKALSANITLNAADVSAVPTTRTVNAKALSADITLNATDIGLGSVTNDAQTKAAIVPNTVPSAGQIHVGNAGGTAFGVVGMSGDATLSSAGALIIGNQAVTLAKLVNASATSRVLLRKTAGAGSWEEGTAADLLAFLGNTQGQILIRDGTGWTILAPGTAGQVLKTGGAAANPAWVGTKEMLANVTLGSAGTSLASGTIAARRFLEVHIFITGYAGSDTASLQFNGAAGTAYRYNWSTITGTTLAAGLTAVSTDRIKVDSTNTTQSRRIVAFISNDSTLTEKLVKFESVFGTGGSGAQTTNGLGNGAWVSGGATQITSISLVSSSNMNANTQMVIFGWN